MTITITVANSKGGVAKTTTVLSLAVALKTKEYKVLTIDLDGQGNCSSLFDTDPRKATIYDVLIGKATIDKTIQHTEYGDIIPFDARMSYLDVDVGKVKGKESLLKNALAKMKASYDFVMIDTAPSLLGASLVNALTCSDYVLIPTTMDSLGLDAVEQIGSLIKTVQKKSNKSLKIMGILPTRTQPRLAIEQLTSEYLNDTAKAMGTEVFENHVRNCSAIRDAQFTGKSVFEYNKKSNASRDYNKVADELLTKIGKAPAKKKAKQ